VRAPVVPLEAMLLLTDTLARMASSDPPPGAHAATAGRDRTRFEEEALMHAEQLYRIALRLTGSPQSAEDLVQDTYLRAFRAWESYKPGTNLAAWLATIMRNANLDELRRQSRRPVQQPLDDDGDYYLYNRLAESGPQPQDEVLARLSGNAIVSAVGDLPPNFREVVVLVDVGDFSYADAADILGIPIGTVMSRLYRGRRLLKRALADHAGGEAA
jgi:RNA polymerase sigma-70 factor (ECF subfamily)